MKEKIEFTEYQLLRLKDYWAIFSLPEGQRVLEDMEKSYCTLPYTVGDANDTFRKIGNMEVVWDIKRAMEIKNRPFEIIKEKEGDENEM